MTDDRHPFLRAFGPGLLFAGAAVGVSHLVQSTRAGAGYGLSLLVVVLVANLLKYPAFRFGSLYAAATGHSLLEGYRRQGRWALWLYGLLTLATMFTVAAAVTVVTAGLLGMLIGVRDHPLALSAVLLVVCGVILAVGRFVWLDRVIKVVVAILTVATLVAAGLAVPHLDFAGARWWPDVAHFSAADFAFVAALVGWMPSAVDVAVWQSLWTLAKADANQTSGLALDQPDARAARRARLAAVRIDFDVGYTATALLAFCFVVLGAAVMYGSGQAPAATATGFAEQIITLYAAMLGQWARPLIAVAAFAVMFSTTLTVMDGFPRALATLRARLRSPEKAGEALLESRDGMRAYWAALLVVALGALAVLGALPRSLPALIDLATTLSFLTAPILAWLNHRAVHGAEVPPDARPSRFLSWFSRVGMLFMGGFAVWYLIMRWAI
jgi:Mn2+/Fe2+ NRAMP family transporter